MDEQQKPEQAEQKQQDVGAKRLELLRLVSLELTQLSKVASPQPWVMCTSSFKDQSDLAVAISDFAFRGGTQWWFGEAGIGAVPFMSGNGPTSGENAAYITRSCALMPPLLNGILALLQRVDTLPAEAREILESMGQAFADVSVASDMRRAHIHVLYQTALKLEYKLTTEAEFDGASHAIELDVNNENGLVGRIFIHTPLGVDRVPDFFEQWVAGPGLLIIEKTLTEGENEIRLLSDGPRSPGVSGVREKVLYTWKYAASVEREKDIPEPSENHDEMVTSLIMIRADVQRVPRVPVAITVLAKLAADLARHLGVPAGRVDRVGRMDLVTPIAEPNVKKFFEEWQDRTYGGKSALRGDHPEGFRVHHAADGSKIVYSWTYDPQWPRRSRIKP